MAVSPTYPGIYIQEAPSLFNTIEAAPTNLAVFIGYTHPLKTWTANYGVPVEVFAYSDYTAQFGSFIRSGAYANAYGPAGNQFVFGDMAQAISQFFLNGGTQAYIVSVNGNNATLPNLTPSMLWLNNGILQPVTTPNPPTTGILFSAIEVTDELFAMTLTIRPIPASSPPGDPLADIVITYGPAGPGGGSPPYSSAVAPGPGTVVETYRRVSLSPRLADGKTANPNYIVTRIGASIQQPVSKLVTVAVLGATPFPSSVTTQLFPIYLPQATNFFAPGDFTAVLQEDTPLDKLPVFNLMILPGIADNSATFGNVAGPAPAPTRQDESGPQILSTAVAFCERKMAFLIMDPPFNDTADGTVFPPAGQLPASAPQANQIANTINQGSTPESKNAALYFPYLLSPDPITGSATNPVTGLPSQIPPAATVAGLYAKTDLTRGVWKAPAGFQTQTVNVTGVVLRGRMTDQRQGTLNPIGVNCLRQFPNIPTVVFGARTLVTQTDQQWRYVPVRRMALFLEQSLYASLKWVIFEPNADPLWSAIRMTINGFMLGLFKQGAFGGGDTPSTAFLVQCDDTTTSPTDIANGIVNIVVAFAPLEPAEFVVITIAQLAGQAQTS